MPRTRKDEAPVLIQEPEVTGRYVELAGYTVSFETFHTDSDPAAVEFSPSEALQATMAVVGANLGQRTPVTP